MGSTTVFVTGASAGFGEAIARRFAADGARLVISARRAERITELGKELGGDVLPLTLDVRDREAVASAVSGLPPGFAAIDVLVNNAGLALGLEPATGRTWTTGTGCSTRTAGASPTARVPSCPAWWNAAGGT